MKNFNKNVSLIGLILLLSACGSTPKEETHYFVLNPSHSPSLSQDQSQSTSLNSAVSAEPIALQPVQLAKYLDQPGIVLQTDQHEIKVAHFHRWAEPLKHNLHRYITQSIGFSTINDASRTLEVHFQNFNGTQNGSAIVSGYWVFNQKQHPFSYQAPLTNSGYTELVKQLALLLDQLCADIAAQIT